MAFVFIGKDETGADVEMMFPAEGIQAVFNDAAIKIQAHQNASLRSHDSEWFRSFHREETPAQIGSTTDGKVVLIARHGLPDETRLSFSPQHAIELSEALRAGAESTLKPRDERAH
jgi:hypothetical protein